jgi:putative hydroxymethylpyrimidine transport system substrate-binding protein
MTHVGLMLEYFHPWPNSAGFYLARERGWYQAEGLDVEIRVFDPVRGDTLAHLLRDEVHFGVFPSNRLLVRRESAAPLIGIAAINHGGLETIQTVKQSGITRPRELAGRRLAMGPTPRGIAMVNHLVASDGGNPEAVIIVDNRGREFTVDDIAAGEFDATFGGYWAWDALFGTLPESERITWRVDDIGAPPYHSYLLGTQESLVQNQPELVRRFLSATARGYLAAIADPAAALAAMERVTPYFPRPILKRSIDLISASWTYEGRWGEQRAGLLAPYAEWLHRHGILRTQDGWRSAVTNDLLPAGSIAT